MGEMSPSHWLIVAVVFIVLFGSRKLPDAARSIGRSLRILKSEIGGAHADDHDEVPAATAGPARVSPGAPEVTPKP